MMKEKIWNGITEWKERAFALKRWPNIGANFCGFPMPALKLSKHWPRKSIRLKSRWFTLETFVAAFFSRFFGFFFTCATFLFGYFFYFNNSSDRIYVILVCSFDKSVGGAISFTVDEWAPKLLYGIQPHYFRICFRNNIFGFILSDVITKHGYGTFSIQFESYVALLWHPIHKYHSIHSASCYQY